MAGQRILQRGRNRKSHVNIFTKNKQRLRDKKIIATE